MKAEELVRAGRLEEALADLQSAVRSKPEDARLRIFLFQVQCLVGKWEKALVQLQVLADLNAETFLLSRVFQPVIQCEMLREKIFAGKRSPIIFGEPMSWVGLLVQANEHLAHGDYQAAQSLREQAFEEAPATAGQVNEQAFEWIADADSRLGPLLEVILEGRYYWVPFCRIKQIQMEKPNDLRDLVWMPARFQWVNEGEATGHIPVRYAGATGSEDGPLRLARKTAWTEHEGGHYLGRGQRILATDQAEYPLLECRRINLSPLSACPD
jgi:type VI secretion system protein ImpE